MPLIRSRPMTTKSQDSGIATAPVWRILLFGGLRAQRGEHTLNRFRSQKFAALLAYLALFPRRVHTREELSDLLWPEIEVEAARANLRGALSFLRRELEPDDIPEGTVLEKRGHTYVRLEPSAFSSDVADFESAVQAAARASVPAEMKIKRLTEAIALYQGPLLPGVYESWALAERDRLAETYLKALYQVTRLLEQMGDGERALEYARQAVIADPTNEEANAHVLRLLMATGQSAAARRHFENLERLLDKELGTTPGRELRTLLEPGRVPPLTTPSLESPLPAPGQPRPAVLATAPRTAASPTATLTVAAPAPTPLVLPAILTPFFGRERELARLQEALRPPQSVRLLTITGPGGSGKSRLSIEAARSLSELFTGGIWFVSLSEIKEPERMFDAIADSLAITRSATLTARQQVLEALRQHSGEAPALLLLDTFEHLAEAGAREVETLLHQLPRLTCLVTSRQRLWIDGEQELPLAPLPTPHVPGAPERLLEFASVQLFVNRAKAVRSDFQLTERNSAPVADLCARLEGIPLAIELAAAWAAILTPAQILSRLNDRFELLVARRRDAPERHRTLRAAMEWSYQLLPPEIQRFFAHLSVFRGGWSLEAAEAVTGEDRTLEFLSELRDRSLVVTVEEISPLGEPDTPTGDHFSEATQMRFRMLDTLSEFAAEQVTEEAARDELRERHLRHFVDLAELAEPELRGRNQVAYLRLLELEHENLRAALDWSLEEGRSPEIAELGLRLAGGLVGFWMLRSHIREGRTCIQRALERAPDAPVENRLRAYLGAAHLAWRVHDQERVLELTETIIALSRSLEDRRAWALAINLQGRVAQQAGKPLLARQLMEQAKATARELEHPWLLAYCLHSLGHLLHSHGEAEYARQTMEESLALFQMRGDTYNIGLTLRALGMIYRTLLRDQEAVQAVEESITLFQQLRDNGTVALAQQVLGYIQIAIGNHQAAFHHLDSAYRACREIGDKYGSTHALHNRGRVRIKLGQLDAAKADLDESLRSFVELGYSGDIALSLEMQGILERERGNWERMVTLTAAGAIRRTSFAPLSPADQAEQEADLQQARQAIGEERYQKAWQRGYAMNLEDALTFALSQEA